MDKVRRKHLITGTLVCVCLVSLARCSNDDRQPATVGPLPEVDFSSLDADLADRLNSALAILRSRPEEASFNGEAAMMLHAYQQIDLAETFYKRAQTLEPSSLRWPYYLGVIAARGGRHDEAVTLFDVALEIDPTFLPARKRKARALLELERLDDSRAIYDELVAESPDDAEIRNGLGKVHAALGNSEDAVIHLARAVQAAPNFGEVHYALALAYRDLGEEKQSQQHLEQYENDKYGAPSGTDPLMTAVSNLNISAAEYLKAGVEARDAGKFPEAIGLHLRAIQTDPQLQQAHINLIVLYGGSDQSESAEFHYQRALALNPNSAELHYNYGVLAYDQEKYGAAATAFQRALEINPEYAAANNNMGQMHEQNGRLDEAIKYYRRAVANRPDYGLAHYHLGRMMMLKRRPADAVRELQLALREESPQTPTYLVTLAAVFQTLGDGAQASKTFDLARRMGEHYGQTALVDEIDNEISKLARP